jgi:hypothetical protein
MRKRLVQSSVGWAMGAAVLAMMTNAASAGSFTRGCAARDLQVLMLIEERESENSISQDEVSDAINKMLDARMICHVGRVTDARER